MQNLVGQTSFEDAIANLKHNTSFQHVLWRLYGQREVAIADLIREDTVANVQQTAAAIGELRAITRILDDLGFEIVSQNPIDSENDET